ncbi:MAG TPA: hypothetical protein VI756_17190, partial [Blastocatellia bacterium]
MYQRAFRIVAVLMSLACAALVASGLVAGASANSGSTAVTFSRDVAPILFNKCATCHRPGETAPMSLLTFKDARPWARSIKEKVISKTMPPWHADPAYGKFENERSLSLWEIDTISKWVDAGAPEGDPKDLPPAPKFSEGWKIGTPDQIFTMPLKFDVPATGVVDYQYFAVPTHFSEDKWVQAAEVRPGNPAVVHHVIVYIQNPTDKRSGATGGGRGQDLDSLAGIAPGGEPTILPDGVGIRLRAGSVLIFQVHYTPNGTAQTDQTSVGIIFSKKPVVKEDMGGAAMNMDFVIPPGDPNYEVKSSMTIDEDSHLTSLMPHMHFRGKDFQYRLVYPDGTSKIILSVPHYDFSWQTSYDFAEPIAAPKGSRIECVAHFDNSPGNKTNPDPSKAVRWGPQTWDEMMIGFVDFTLDHQNLLAPEAAKTSSPAAGQTTQPVAQAGVEPDAGALMKPPESLPTAAQILDKYLQALGGKAAIMANTSQVMKGTVKVPSIGADGTIEIDAKAPNKTVTDAHSGFLGRFRSGYDGSVAWEEQSGQVQDAPDFDPPDGDFYLPVKLQELYPGIAAKGTAKIRSTDTYVLEAPASGKTKRWYFDTRSGLLVRTELLGPDGKSVDTYDYDDYRPIDGTK